MHFGNAMYCRDAMHRVSTAVVDNGGGGGKNYKFIFHKIPAKKICPTQIISFTMNGIKLTQSKQE